jgi:hypothetical protein
MKHVKLFEDFNPMMSPEEFGGEGDSSMDTRESFIVLTGDQGNGSYSLSHVNSVEEVDLLRMKFSGEDSVFDAIPYTGKNYVGSGFIGDGFDIKLTEYETPEEGFETGDYPQFFSRKEEDQDKENSSGLGDGILWEVPPVGFTEVALWGGSTEKIPNRKYFRM